MYQQAFWNIGSLTSRISEASYFGLFISLISIDEVKHWPRKHVALWVEIFWPYRLIRFSFFLVKVNPIHYCTQKGQNCMQFLAFLSAIGLMQLYKILLIFWRGPKYTVFI